MAIEYKTEQRRGSRADSNWSVPLDPKKERVLWDMAEKLNDFPNCFPKNSVMLCEMAEITYGYFRTWFRRELQSTPRHSLVDHLDRTLRSYIPDDRLTHFDTELARDFRE